MKKLVYILTLFLAIASVQASELSTILDELKDLVTLSDRVRALEQKPDVPSGLLQSIEARINALENEPKPKDESAKFTFVLMDDDGDNFADDEWEEIIAKGQAIQAEYWFKKEAFWRDKVSSPSGPGWLGTATMPIIRILCVEPEYFFHNTVRLPGRFEVLCPSRWGSILRFYGDGYRALIDDVVYGFATMAPVGIYVEPETTVKTSSGDIIIRPFEQAIRNLVLAAHNGSLPVYMAQNQDRFSMRSCKFLQHEGRLSEYIQVAIKHGPPLRTRNYPFPAVQSPQGNVWLTEPSFSDIQFEGPHSNKRREAIGFFSGANMRFTDFTILGWKMGIYCHGGYGRVISGWTMDHGKKFAKSQELLPWILCTTKGEAPDVVQPNASGLEGWVLPKFSPAPRTAGWHTKGEAIF